MSLPVNNASTYIQWQVIRKNSAFIKRQRGIPKLFSTEKFNIRSLNGLRHSGLVNKKGVEIQLNKDGKGLTVTSKNKRFTYKPAQSRTVVNYTHGSRATLKSLKKSLKNYKGSGQRYALLRASQYLRAAKPITASKSAAKTSPKKTEA